MNVDLFDFELPRDRIADRPVIPRDAARLLHVGREGLADLKVGALAEILRPGDIAVFNDTRVIPARLRGRRGQAGIEATLHRRTGPDRWKAFVRPAKKLKEGDLVVWAGDFSATVLAKSEAGEIEFCFDKAGAALMEALERHGEMPLPPYIRREAGADERDLADYQTIFAKDPGAVAAPTAGLHFTDALLAALDRRGVLSATLTLHVGAGTFLPVKAADTDDHRMHAEWGRIGPELAERINRAKAQGGRLLAVGTTALRLLESAADAKGRIDPFEGETDIFITPGYRFKAVDLLMTNFHLPRSTLFMLVSAFAGLDRMQDAYRHARQKGYRFYSYGDASLLERQDGF